MYWLLLFCSVYSYFLYPVILLVIDLVFSSKAVASKGARPQKVSLIVTAYNEEARIREKIDNTLEINSDGFDLELIVASDCSSDATEGIVSEYSDKGVTLVRANERLGKENAQRCAIEQSTGDIIVFSDVATQIPSDAINCLLEYFTQSDIGAISSEDRFVSQKGELAGEGAYVKYEMWLRAKESKRSGLVGLSGSFFAARREVCEQWDIRSPSDFNTALNCARLGLRAVNAPDVLGYYTDIQDPQKEYQRKVRTVLRGITGLFRHIEVVNPLEFGFFAFAVFSHKVMRWLVPWFLLLFAIVNVSLLGKHWFYNLSFFAQLLFYGAALLAHRQPRFREHTLIRIIYFFVQVNVAIAEASIKFLSGNRMTVWQPSKR